MSKVLSFRFVKVGCDRTVISKDKDEDSNKKANEYKEMGNDAFRQAQAEAKKKP